MAKRIGSRANPKQTFTLIGGPWSGQKLKLSPDGSTLAFKVKSYSDKMGRYVGGVWREVDSV